MDIIKATKKSYCDIMHKTDDQLADLFLEEVFNEGFDWFSREGYIAEEVYKRLMRQGLKKRFRKKIKNNKNLTQGDIMTKGRNINHPKKGDQIKVEPIKGMKDVKAIKNLLKDNPRDLALFVIGINTNLRASDLLKLTVFSVIHTDEIEIKEKKTGKLRRITLNGACLKVIDDLVSGGGVELLPGDYLFTGQRGVLTVPTLNNMVKRWCGMINLRGNFGSHTLRKTWGYHQRVTFGVDIPRLMVCFNHKNQKQTLDYLCIQPEEIRDVYMNEL